MPPVPGLSEAQMASGNRSYKAATLATSGSGRLQVWNLFVRSSLRLKKIGSDGVLIVCSKLYGCDVTMCALYFS